MKKNKFKIGWQKYEDIIEKQLSSPMLNDIMRNFVMQNIDLDEDEDEELENVGIMQSNHMPMIVPISEQLVEEMYMLSNFDCWMGHTNFDITPKVKEKLNSIPGIELLKICSRYRFFIGIGSMFEFSDVRKKIEEVVLPQGD